MYFWLVGDLDLKNKSCCFFIELYAKVQRHNKGWLENFINFSIAIPTDIPPQMAMVAYYF